jgi:glucose/mannose-6-phosphate isomerase
MSLFELDDLAFYPKIDRSDMRKELLSLPAQLKNAWKMGLENEFPAFNKVNYLVLVGMGGMAIGADLLTAYASDLSPYPVQVLREYQLPSWARGKHTLVVVFSHSGDTEEALSVFNQALQHDCSLMVISTGGEISKQALAYSIPLWKFAHSGQSSSAVGYFFGLLLALMTRLNFISDQANAIQSALAAMERMIRSVDIDIPVKQNPAKRMAGQMLDRRVTIVGSDYLVPVARRFKSQINELSKSWAQFERLREMNHNTLAVIFDAEDVSSKTMVLFLSASFMHPCNRLRINLTRMELLRAGMNTDVVEFKEDSRLAEIWASVVFGDFLSYYLAMSYQVDPTPIDKIQNLEKAMG